MSLLLASILIHFLELEKHECYLCGSQCTENALQPAACLSNAEICNLMQPWMYNLTVICKPFHGRKH